MQIENIYNIEYCRIVDKKKEKMKERKKERKKNM